MSKNLINCAITVSTHPALKYPINSKTIPSEVLLKDSLQIYRKIIFDELEEEATLIPVDFVNSHILTIISKYQHQLLDESQNLFANLISFLKENHPVDPKLFSKQQSFQLNPDDLYQMKADELLLVHEHDANYFNEFKLVHYLAWYPLTLASTYQFNIYQSTQSAFIIKELLLQWLAQRAQLDLATKVQIETQTQPLNPMRLASLTHDLSKK